METKEVQKLKPVYPIFVISSGNLNFFGAFSNLKKCFGLMKDKGSFDKSQTTFYSYFDAVNFGEYVDFQVGDNTKYRIYKAKENQLYATDVLMF